ncbi:MAG: 16S rRNA (cytidine(1402)-2'-O)-methyltransferase [Cyanobacteriota bacterium ELA615]
MNKIAQSTLYLVGTPIGNLEDMTFRAIKTLSSVDLIAAEDTRHTGRLLAHFQITTAQISYHQHNQSTRIPELIEHLEQGKSIALVTDAGMPGISDPGYELVSECIKHGINVCPIPGVSASLAAIVVSGMSSDRFVFEGFLPNAGHQRKQRLEYLRNESRSMIFYEAPHRLVATINYLLETLGENRQIAIARELTKLHEEIWRGTIAQALDFCQQRQPRGEYTLVVEGKAPEETTNLTTEQIKSELTQLIESGMSRSKASGHLAKITTLSRQYIYKLSLEL